MAIENTLVVKAVAGIATIGGVGGAGSAIYLYKDVLFDTNLRSYLVKKNESTNSLVQSSGSDSSTKTLYKEGKKEFSCKIDETKDIDNGCELIELKEKSKSYVYLEDLVSNPPTKPSTFADSKYYKLTIDISKFDKWNEANLPNINIVDSATEKINIVTLKTLLRVDKIDKDTKTKIVIAKLESTVDSSSTFNLTSKKCKIGSLSGVEIGCSIYKINSGDTTTDKVDFSKLVAITSLSSTDGVQNHFFVISFDEKDTSKLVFNQEEKKIVVSDGSKVASFIFNSFVFNKLETTATNNNVVLLNKLTPPPSS